MKFSIFGSTGFIGNSLAIYLLSKGHQVDLYNRKNLNSYIGKDLGHVIYATGLTGQFRDNTEATLFPHVLYPLDILKNSNYLSFLYLSTTRFYLNHKGLVSEDSDILINSSPDKSYDLSKLYSESLILSLQNPSIRIARLSNVYGRNMSNNTFLGSIINNILSGNDVLIKENKNSSKDYIYIDDVVDLIYKISLCGSDKIYNVASGDPVHHYEIAEYLKKHSKYNINFGDNGPARISPKIDNSKIVNEFAFKPSNFLANVGSILG